MADFENLLAYSDCGNDFGEDSSNDDLNYNDGKPSGSHVPFKKRIDQPERYYDEGSQVEGDNTVHYDDDDDESSDGSNVDDESSDGSNVDDESSDGSNVDDESSDGSNVDDESSDGSKVDDEGSAGSKVDSDLYKNDVDWGKLSEMNELERGMTLSDRATKKGDNTLLGNIVSMKQQDSEAHHRLIDAPRISVPGPFSSKHKPSTSKSLGSSSRSESRSQSDDARSNGHGGIIDSDDGYSVKVTFLESYNEEITDLHASEAGDKNGVYIRKERYYQEESERKAMANQIEHIGVTIEAQQKNNLEKTSMLLANSEEEVKKCQYTLKEKDVIIAEQRKAENALAHQACVLCADLEKAHEYNASLSSKIAKLAEEVGSLRKLSEQNEHLQYVEKLCHSFLGINEKMAINLKKKLTALKKLCMSRNKAMQNIVCLHKAGSDATLNELSSIVSSYGHSIKESLSTQQHELALFARELQRRLNLSVGQIKYISKRSKEESKKLQGFTSSADHMQLKSITEFKQAYEVDAKLVDLRESGIMNKEFLDKHVIFVGHAEDTPAAEELLLQSVNMDESTSLHTNRTHGAHNYSVVSLGIVVIIICDMMRLILTK